MTLGLHRRGLRVQRGCAGDAAVLEHPDQLNVAADAQRSRAARCTPGPMVWSSVDTRIYPTARTPHDHTLAQQYQVVDVESTTTLAGAVADRPVFKFTLEHAALVAAARLQAPPPALQEVG